MTSRFRGWLRPSGWPLDWRMSLIFWALAVVPALAAVSYLYLESESAQRQRQDEALQDAATRVAGRLSQMITDTWRLNAYLALNPDLPALLAGGAGADRVQAMLHRVIVANRDVELLMVLDRDGKCLVSTDQDLVGRNFGFREYFKLAIQARPHVTGLTVGSVLGNTGVYFSHPISTGDGKVVGAFVTKMMGRAFVEPVEAERRSKAQTAFLLDGEGVVIYHPEPEWMLRSLMPLPDKAQKAIVEDRRFGIPAVPSLGIPSLHEAVMKYRSSGSVRWLSPKSGEHERAGYVQVPGHNWTVVVSSPERHLALDQLRLERTLVAALAVVLLASGAAFFLLRLTLVRPLKDIVAAARRIARGEYRGTRAGSAAGELGEIAGALDVAALELHQRSREHEALGRILLPEVRQKLLPRRAEGGAIGRLAVVYCALSGIHEMLDRRPSSEVLAALGDYSEEISAIVRPWGGQVNTISGHAIAAVLAAPLTEGNLESYAVSAALAIQRRIAELNRTRAEINEPVVEIAVGVCTAGILVTGAANAHERYLNLMLNDGINVAGTLAALGMQTPGRPVMINHTTYVGVRNRTDITPVSLGPQKLRGRAELSEVYSVTFGMPAPLAPAQPTLVTSQLKR